MSGSSRNRKAAPQFLVPDVPIVSVEHPCLVQNVDRAIRMLGRDSEIADSLERGNEKPLGLRFQPNDPTSREVVSYNKKTDNLLLKVTVPKRIRKIAKTTSNEELTESLTTVSTRRDVSYLLRSLKDNPQHYQAEIVGSIHSTHVWRTMPDFVYSTKGSMFFNEVQTKILPQEYPGLKEWSLPRASAAASADTEAIPPPTFSTQSLPQNYAYRQNLSTKTVAAKPTSRDTETPAEALPDQSQLDGEEPSVSPSELAVRPKSLET
jgi:general transcription factor 3C polypeptide 5 (transcription factor C subunit 1)